MNFLSPENHENTILEEVDFQFNCFGIQDAETLPHWHKHTEIIYVRRGTCAVYTNGTAVICEEGDILLVPHGSLHSILPQIPAEYFAIVIGSTLFVAMMQDRHCEAALRPFLSGGSLAPLHLTHSDASYFEFAKLINNIIKEDFDKEKNYQLLIKVGLLQFFTHLIRYFPDVLHAQLDTHNQANNTILMKQALEYLSLHYREKITIADMSAHSNLSDQHFCRLFKSYTGKTFINYLTDLRLEHANRLLTDTDNPITVIPEMIGFCNANYFARIYKNRYGHSPSYVRKNGSAMN